MTNLRPAGWMPSASVTLSTSSGRHTPSGVLSTALSLSSRKTRRSRVCLFTVAKMRSAEATWSGAGDGDSADAGEAQAVRCEPECGRLRDPTPAAPECASQHHTDERVPQHPHAKEDAGEREVHGKQHKHSEDEQVRE